MRAKINYAGPWITEKEVSYVEDAVRNGFYENYKKHASALENSVAERLGVKHAFATNSCTAAIHLALLGLEIGQGDEVITTDATCVASALPISYVGATAVFVDVHPSDWCLSPEAVEAALTDRTKAILVVHWNGYSCDVEAIKAIADKRGIPVIEDAAASLGGERSSKKVGAVGEVGCFSFQGAKVAIGGMGGMVTTDRDDVHERIKVFASYGRTDSEMMYWSDYVGFNYTMPNLPAALALAQVERLDELIDRKRLIVDWYERGLSDVPHVRLIREDKNSRGTCCYPPLELSEEAPIDRADLIQKLQESNIDIRPAQPRCSGMPMFERRFENPVARGIEERGLILPSAFNLTEDDVAYVCDQICLHTFKKNG